MGLNGYRFSLIVHCTSPNAYRKRTHDGYLLAALEAWDGQLAT